MSPLYLAYVSNLSPLYLPRQVELDEMENGPAVQDALLASSGQRTVPWLGLGLAPLDPSPLALRVAATSTAPPSP